MKTVASLFELTKEHLEIMALIELNEGVLDEECEQALKINKDNLAIKALHYVNIIKHCEGELAKAKEAEKQLESFVARKTSIINRLKENLENALVHFGPIEAGFYKLSLRKSEQVIIENEAEIPQEFQSIKITQVPDKMKIKSAIKADYEVPGAALKTKYNLQIK